MVWWEQYDTSSTNPASTPYVRDRNVNQGDEVPYQALASYAENKEECASPKPQPHPNLQPNLQPQLRTTDLSLKDGIGRYHAKLLLAGDWEDITCNWSPAELQASRRLVSPVRRASANILTANFLTVPPEERLRSTRISCISCIWWKEKKGYYVTCADIIALLKMLLVRSFTSDQAQRIRKMLITLGAHTISGELTTERFHGLVMGLSWPQARRVYGKTSVLAWSDLIRALTFLFDKCLRYRCGLRESLTGEGRRTRMG